MPPPSLAAALPMLRPLPPLPMLRPLPMPLPMPPLLPWRTHTTYDSIYAAPGMARDTNPIPHALEQLRVAALGKAIGGGGEAYKPLFEVKPDDMRKNLWWEQLKQSFAVLSKRDEGVQALADAAATSVGGFSIVAALLGVACALMGQLPYAAVLFGASLGLGLLSWLFRMHPTVRLRLCRLRLLSTPPPAAPPSRRACLQHPHTRSSSAWASATSFPSTCRRCSSWPRPVCFGAG